MRRLLLLLQLLLCMLPAIGQDSLFRARVVEAETGDPLPLVGVYVSADVNTLTNYDGEFSLSMKSDDVVRLTCIGRRTQTFRASELPAVIRMSMRESTLAEVEVTAIESLLAKVARQFEKDYKSKRSREAQYFYRQTSVMGGKQDIVEAFVKALSASNLRELTFISGRHGAISRQHWEQSALRNMNLHHILELGPMPFDVPFWKNLVTPLPHQGDYVLSRVSGELNGEEFKMNGKGMSEIAYLQHIYQITAEETRDDDGQRLLVVRLRLREGLQLKQPVMTGTLYIDRNKLRVLAFDGRVENMLLQLRRSELQSPINVPVGMKFHIDYRYDHKYAEVADLSMDTSWEVDGFDATDQPLLAQLNSFRTRTLLFNVDEQKRLKRKDKKRTQTGENMLAAIDEAGYDSTFWANNDVVLRTSEEEAIANGTIDREQALRDSLNAYIADLSPVARLADRLKRFGRAVPQEKVFVHMDNTGYFLGDTIWFAAYTRKTNTDTPSRMSRVLYAELWNHDGYLVERKLVEMKDGRGHGFFALPDTLYSGYFELRAYTRWQLNWGQTEHPHEWSSELRFFSKAMAKDFFRDYEKLYSRVFPVYDKPKEEGDYYKDMTYRPLRRYFKTAPKEPELRLSLFPEGGNLVAGVPCRVAFEAATSEGEVREGTLRLMRGKTELLSTRTENRGRGTFTFTPEEGAEYEAVFVEEGKAKPAESPKKATKKTKTSSPQVDASHTIKDVKAEGVALQVSRDSLSGRWRFDIAARGKAAAQPLGVTVMNEGRLTFFQEFQPTHGQAVQMLYEPEPDTDGQPQAYAPGVHQVTVFDSIGHIYADRLFFISQPAQTQPSLRFVGVKDQYEPFEEIELMIQGQPTPSPSLGRGDPTGSEPAETSSPPQRGAGGGLGLGAGLSVISLAIRDAVHTDNTFDSGNIMTEMLLSSEIKGFVPQPEYFFERDDEEHRRALDLLMMTQGWRRFNWQDMAVAGSWDLTHPAEHTQMVSGTVNRYTTEEVQRHMGISNDGQQNFFDSDAEGVMNYATGENSLTNPLNGFTPEGGMNVSDLQRQMSQTFVNLAPTYNTRSNIGAIADTRNGIYGAQGRQWTNTDYNALNFKTAKDYRSRQKSRYDKVSRQYLEAGHLKRDVTIHAEFVNPFNPKNVVVGESMTKNGRFLIDMPRFTGECYFHLAAADTTKWKHKTTKRPREDKNAWIKLEQSTIYDMIFPVYSVSVYDLPGMSQFREGNTGVDLEPSGKMPDMPDFYVRINFSYPRWIKPYTYYQVHEAALRDDRSIPADLLTDSVHLMNQVTIRARHGGLRHIDYSKPAYVLDAYEAANLGIDAGLAQIAFDAQEAALNAAFVLVGDMGMARHFNRKISVNQTITYSDVENDPPHGSAFWSTLDQQRNRMLSYMDKMYIYTDYSPRREGDERFDQANQPEVQVDFHRMPDEGERQIFVNRHFILPGFAYQEDFYHPDYRRNPPKEGQKDYRRTLYWNPELKLDENGNARVRLFNNSQYTSLLIEAEGQTESGALLYGR